MITPLDILSLETWVLIFSIVVLIRYYFHKKWQVLKDLGIPHEPPTVLGLGNLGQTIKDPDTMFTLDLERKKKFGLVYGLYTFLTPRIIISDPDVLKQIFIKEAGTFRDRQRLFQKINGKEMNAALTITSGDQWKRIRNTISPTFSTSKLKDMYVIVDQCTDITVESLQKLVKEENGRFNAKDVFGKLSMDVICSSAFGVNAHTQEGESDLVKYSKKLFSQSFFGVVVMLITTYFSVVFPFLEKFAERLNYSIFDKKLMNYYKRLVDTSIANKIAAKENARVDILHGMLTNEITEDDVKRGVGKGVTRTEIVGNSILMLLAGYETTANTILFLAYCIALEPEVQEKLYAEVLATKKKHGGITYESISSMNYLDMCMKESQRLYPAIPRNSRYTDVEITLKGITIPAGTHVDIPTFGMNRDEEYWEEPLKYMPERFEDMSKIDPMVYQPFGAGPRNCIGMRLAILEVKMAIAKLLLNFQLDVCDDTPKPPLRMTVKASMQPKDDVFLRVVPRVEAEE